jgi:heme-degrading monooxygenase HmoA
VIVCLRTVGVPADVRERYLAWIVGGRHARQAHGILAELVCEPCSGQGEFVVITVWPDHETFNAWIATPNATPSPRRRCTRPSTTGRSPATT